MDASLQLPSTSLGHGELATSDPAGLCGVQRVEKLQLGQVSSRNVQHSATQLAGSSATNITTHYQWDARGQRTQLRIQGTPNKDITSTWDAAGQLQSLQASSDTSPSQFTHDGAGRLTQITRSDGSSTSYQYTPDGHISQIRHQGNQGQTLAQFDYQHNRDGQRTQAVEVIHAAGSTAPTTQRTIDWTYDSAGKLTSEQITQTQPTAQTLSIAYQYDKVGNRTSRTVTGAINQTTTYQYDANDRLTSQNDSIEGTTSYRYDQRGNLVEKASGNNKTAYSWNSDNRLIKVEHTGQNNKTIQYGYDPQGRRIKKLVQQGASKTETHYSLDSERPYHEVAVESTRVNTQPWTHKTYVHTPGGVGELISQSDGTTTKQIYADVQGTTRLIADGTTGTSRSYSFDAFGNALEGDSLAANQNPPTHLYTGERYDADTGLIYLRARDYDPSTGRFISMDEHPGDQRIPLTLNKYLYANADPVNHVDPSGNVVLGTFVNIGFSMNFQGVTRVSSAQGARIAMRQILFGKPPDSLGIIGEMILDRMIDSVAEVVVSGVDFPNKGAAGTRAHQNLKRHIHEIAKEIEEMSHGDIVIKAEPFADDDGEHYKKGRRGAVGIDVLIKHKGENILGIDLKIGKGYSKKGIRKRRSYYGDILQINFEFL